MGTIIFSVLAAYYVTTALTKTDGIFGLFYKLRNIKAVENFGVLECFVCTAFWVSLVIALLVFPESWLLYSLGIAGAITLLNSFTEY